MCLRQLLSLTMPSLRPLKVSQLKQPVNCLTDSISNKLPDLGSLLGGELPTASRLHPRNLDSARKFTCTNAVCEEATGADSTITANCWPSRTIRWAFESISY